PTPTLALDRVAAGVRAALTCVDPKQLSAGFVGRSFDPRLLADLPPGVDPCGERGEFHTFVWDAPHFHAPVDIEVGDVIERDGFVFCDFRPADATHSKLPGSEDSESRGRRGDGDRDQ